MKYEHFLKLLLSYKKFNETISELHDIGFDLYEGKYKVAPLVEGILDTTFESHYTKEGIEWIDWFIYEADYGTKDWSNRPAYGLDKDGKMVLVHKEGEVRWGATDENDNPICYSFESLFEYIEQFKINK